MIRRIRQYIFYLVGNVPLSLEHFEEFHEAETRTIL